MAASQDETETELELEFFISHILRIGVLIAAAVIGFGVLLWVLKATSGYSDSTYPIVLATIVRDAAALRPLAVIQVGLLLLVLTPVVRVAASLFLFARAAACMAKRPRMIGGLAVVAGYLHGYLTRQSRSAGPELVRFVRRQQSRPALLGGAHWRRARRI